MHMSVLQEAKVVLFCQSTSRAGAVNTNNRRNIRDHDKETAIPNNLPPITYLDETNYRLFLVCHLLPVTRLIGTVWRAQIIFSIPVDNLDALHGIYLMRIFWVKLHKQGKTLPPPSLLPATHIMGYVQNSSLCKPVRWRNWKKTNPEKMWIISSVLDKDAPVNARYNTREGGGAGGCVPWN